MSILSNTGLTQIQVCKGISCAWRLCLAEFSDIIQTLSILHNPFLLLVANVAWALLTLIHMGNFLGYPRLDRELNPGVAELSALSHGLNLKVGGGRGGGRGGGGG